MIIYIFETDFFFRKVFKVIMVKKNVHNIFWYFCVEVTS